MIKKIFTSIRDKTFKMKFNKFLFFHTYKLFSPFVYFFKINENQIICDNFFGRGYADNPKYIAEELHRRNPELIIYWLVDSQKIDIDTFPKYIKIIDQYSLESLICLAKSKFWIFNMRRPIRIPKKRGQYYIQTWHGGLGPKACEKDAIETLHASYVKLAKLDSKQIDVCISGSRLLSNLYNTSFWYGGEVLECGSPRNDILFSEESKKTIKKIFVNDDEKICMYAPTFRKNMSTKYYDIDYLKLKINLENRFGGNWKILVRLHPNFMNSTEIKLPDFVHNVTSYSDAQELISISDCLITDYSSIIYDFMYMKKPAFLYASDYEEYSTTDRKLYFTLDSTPFSIAQNNIELQSNILAFDETTYSEQIDLFIKKHGGVEKGTASKSVVEWMMSK